MSEDEKAKGSWWQTVPGTLTALSGVFTAVAGLLLALNQIGLINLKEKASPPSRAASSEPAKKSQDMPATAPADPGPATASHSSKTEAEPNAINPATSNSAPRYLVAFPSGTEVTVGNTRSIGIYKILAAEASRKNAGKLGLKFSIRLTNTGRSDLGFSNDSFRLLVDGVPRAPVSRLIDLVEAKSAKEADVLFDIPESAKTLELTVDSGQESANIPVVLKTAR
jgi:hypothetical protein